MKRLIHRCPRIIASVSCLTAAGCTVGPDFENPVREAVLGSRFRNDLAQTANLNPPKKGWWTEIEDPVLKRYIAQLRRDNLSLQESFYRVEQARERVTITKADLLPALSTDTTGGRSFAPSQADSARRIYEGSYTTELSLSWQLDLFGKIRRSTESARAEFEATKADLDGVWHSLVASLARERIAASVNQRLLELAVENTNNRRRILERVRRRYDLGAQNVGARDVYLAEDNFRSTQADAAEFERLLTDNLYRIDVLLGRPPGTVLVKDATKFPLMDNPPAIPKTLPLSLLDNRPDLRASELRTKAANADIGVAVADLYPNVTISSGIGFTSSMAEELFSADRLTGSLAANIVQRIFEGGALRANIRLQEAELQSLTYEYANQVLTALQEVESALQSETKLREQLLRQGQSVSALEKAESISEDRYGEGLISLQDFLDTQQGRYLAEQNWLLTHQTYWNNRVDLYLALGGELAGGTMTRD